MLDALIQLGLFAAKSLIILAIILIVLIAFFALLSKAKEKIHGRLTVKNLNRKYQENSETLMGDVLPKKKFKSFLKEQKEKNKIEKTQNVYVVRFDGDIKASAVTSLREEITAIINVATSQDEVVVCVESGGGVVHGYGLAASQLMRLRDKHIPLTVMVDKIAASGGYLMACVANKILAAPFAIIGSIGVIVQLPNFNRLLKEKNIDFEQQTAGEYKRTLTIFGKNTDEDREKLQQDIEEIHKLFKNLIKEHRPQINISDVATGEHWLAKQAITLNLVDELKTSDDYILEKTHHANVFEIQYEIKKSAMSKLTGAAAKVLLSLRGIM